MSTIAVYYAHGSSFVKVKFGGISDAVVKMQLFSYGAGAEVGGPETVVVKAGTHLPTSDKDDIVVNAVVDVADVPFFGPETALVLEAFGSLIKDLRRKIYVSFAQVSSPGNPSVEEEALQIEGGNSARSERFFLNSRGVICRGQ